MATYNGNNTTLKIPPNTKVRSINVNSGDIIVGSGCSIEYCNYNEGSITFLGACKISDMEANKGNITVGAGSSITSCYHNSGTINTENNVQIKHVKANKAVISVGRGSKIPEISNNTGTIFISSECEVEVAHFNDKVIAFGPSCSIGRINFNHGTISLANGSQGVEVSANYGFVVGPELAFVKDRRITFEVEPPLSEASSYTGKGLVAFAEQYNADIKKFIATISPTDPVDCRARRLREDPDRGNVNWSLQRSRPEFSAHRQIPPSSTNENVAVQEASSPVKEQDDALVCPICMINRKNVAFQCGHLCCTRCSVGLLNCPICRKEIVQRIQIYL